MLRSRPTPRSTGRSGTTSSVPPRSSRPPRSRRPGPSPVPSTEVSSLAPLLRLYVTVVVAAGLLALAAGLWVASAPTLTEVASAAVLFVLAWLCHRYPIHLGPKLKVTVED